MTRTPASAGDSGAFARCTLNPLFGSIAMILFCISLKRRLPTLATSAD
jgi:hypothetical protein